MAGVRVLRLDRLGGVAPGNKIFKLQGYLPSLGERYGSILSFGGAWSNHIHALAAFGAEYGIPTVGIIRGERPETLSPTLVDAQAWGMQLRFVSRSDYRQKTRSNFLEAVGKQYPGALIVPEGGAGSEGVGGCEAIGERIQQEWPEGGEVLLACATGATLAGLVRSLDSRYRITGVCVLKGMHRLPGQIAGWLDTPSKTGVAWSVTDLDHCGGYARVSGPLREFVLAFQETQSIPLDPVYTGKLMFAIYNRLKRGELAPSAPVLALHTGGLQGRRGFPWLAEG